jgi:hypothetical protein
MRGGGDGPEAKWIRGQGVGGIRQAAFDEAGLQWLTLLTAIPFRERRPVVHHAESVHAAMHASCTWAD